MSKRLSPQNCEYENVDGSWVCLCCGDTRRSLAKRICPAKAASLAHPQTFPPITAQVFDFLAAIADFVADGCTLVTREQYGRRMQVCDNCDRRRHNRCLECGCQLSVKAQGRVFQCPLGRWDDIA